MARRKNNQDETEAGPGFEQALAEIEEIVEAMEHEQLPLEELVARFEKGTRLLDHCENILKSARERIELITIRNTAEDSAPGGTDASLIPSDETDAPDDDDIRLF